ADLAVGRLVVVGAQTDECVRSTLHGAFVRGYDATLVSDAHTTEDLSPWGAPPPNLVIAHTNLYWGNHEAPARTAGTVEAQQIDLRRSGRLTTDPVKVPGLRDSLQLVLAPVVKRESAPRRQVFDGPRNENIARTCEGRDP